MSFLSAFCSLLGPILQHSSFFQTQVLPLTAGKQSLIIRDLRSLNASDSSVKSTHAFFPPVSTLVRGWVIPQLRPGQLRPDDSGRPTQARPDSGPYVPSQAHPISGPSQLRPSQLRPVPSQARPNSGPSQLRPSQLRPIPTQALLGHLRPAPTQAWLTQAQQFRPGHLRPNSTQACPISGPFVPTQACSNSGPSQLRPIPTQARSNSGFRLPLYIQAKRVVRINASFLK